MIKITECPRDAMQGLSDFIPTKSKIKYLQSLLSVGFDILDFGSFVSPRAIPQLKDTAEVLESLDLSGGNTKLLAIVASKKGGEIAAEYDKISYLGFPFSFSPTFLKKNINADLDKVLQITDDFQNICARKNKTLLQYISMAFGNPYGDEWSKDILFRWVEYFHKMGIKKITLSDITAEANPEIIFDIYNYIIPTYPDIDFGVHLHTSFDKWNALVDAAYRAGCRGFDTVLNGMGGCPMSGKELLQNLNTYDLLNYMKIKEIPNRISLSSLNQSLNVANEIFPSN